MVENEIVDVEPNARKRKPFPLLQNMWGKKSSHNSVKTDE